MTKQEAHINVPTIIEFILDETGSMSSCKNGAIAGFNSFLKDQSEIDDECYFTLTKFNTSQKLTVYSDLDIRMVPFITNNTFIPMGMTNLYDVIFERIENLKQRVAAWDIKPRILVVCLTDGGDNSSRKTKSDIKQIISSHEDWSFVYLGANHDATKIANDLGFSDNNVKTFEVENIEQTITELSAKTVAYRSGTVAANAFYGEK